ncbi:MAG: hypothetical protein PHP42_10890, partial [Bacteroidota bacterium]|nr:hypothetical protein [Bacteroidota bacterium]
MAVVIFVSVGFAAEIRAKCRKKVVTTYCRALKEAAIVNLHTPLALAALKFQHNLPKGTHLKYFYS